jgi:hypothetical protein
VYWQAGLCGLFTTKIKKMSNVKRIAVQITFCVELGDVDMPESAKEQLIEIAETCGGGAVKQESTIWPDALDWLNANIREHDSLGHKYSILDIVPA